MTSKYLVNYGNIILDLSNCNAKYEYLMENGNPIPIVSNLGLKPFEKCIVIRSGEYSDFTVEAQEYIPHILTNYHIYHSFNHLINNEFDKSARILNIYQEYSLYGNQLIYYVINKWLVINKHPPVFSKMIDHDFLHKLESDNIKSKIDFYVMTQRHHPINGKIKITNIGTNIKTKEPAVPPEWIGRIFNSAHELHQEMSNLPNRKGKPPVTFCCIYSNTIITNKIWNDNLEVDPDSIILSVTIDKNKNIHTIYEIISNKSKISRPLIKLNNIYLGVDQKILSQSSNYVKTKNVGYLSSLLQKCLRRGPINNTILNKTINDLNNSPSYNLADHNFCTVSGTRQLLWRSFITIMEDVNCYYTNINVDNKTKNQIDITSLVILAIISHLDPKLKLTNTAIECISNTLDILLTYKDLMNWRLYPEMKNIDDLNIELFDINERMKGNINNNDQISIGIMLALKNMPMMSGDRVMLSKILSYIKLAKPKILTLEEITQQYQKTKTDKIYQLFNDPTETIEVAYDMHCKPTILIEIQGMITHNYNDTDNKYLPSLEDISSFIWENFSKKNYRSNIFTNEIISYIDPQTIKTNKLNMNIIEIINKKLFQSVRYVQKKFVNQQNQEILDIKNIDWICKFNPLIKNSVELTDENEKKNIGRIGWLLLFGKTYNYKYKNRVYEIYLAGETTQTLCKIKKSVNGKSENVEDPLRQEIQGSFLEDLTNGNFNLGQTKLYSLPEPYIWKITNKIIELKYINGSFTINNLNNSDCHYVKTLDLSDLIMKNLETPIYYEYDKNMNRIYLPQQLESLVKYVLHNKSDKSDEIDIIEIMNKIIYYRREYEDYRIFRWIQLVKNNLSEIWKLILTRIITSETDNNENKFSIVIGPCDRRGKKTNNSISYKYEGLMFRLMVMFEMIYPQVLKRVSNSTQRWNCDKSNNGYLNMINNLRVLCRSNKIYDYVPNRIKIKTELWTHQRNTIDRIFNGMTIRGGKGYGDASHVGAGKTLCSLGLMEKLYNHNANSNNKNKHKHGGFLVMVPNIELIKTWINELDKHTEGFEIYTQQPNGKLIQYSKQSINKTKMNTFDNNIKSNWIVITTMGRMRDHPIQHSWILVVVDECLSVQNKEALQTEEAWRQSTMSEYGIVMLSATFFRSRFDKMLYMIKMLKTGLPETKEYLNTILSETMITNITQSNREWNIQINKIELSKKQRIEYETIYNKNINNGSEKLYMELNKYIHQKIDYISIFYDIIDKAEQDGKKSIIFTKSKDEADKLVSSVRNNGRVGRYPDKKQYTALSYAEGTYGLNDLVIYDTIIMRPPEPDKLPQIKGRLDRPGQLSNKLEIRYVILKDTIEEASLIRLEMCNNFYNNYLMPLAEFYDLATNKVNNITK